MLFFFRLLILFYKNFRETVSTRPIPINFIQKIYEVLYATLAKILE